MCCSHFLCLLVLLGFLSLNHCTGEPLAPNADANLANARGKLPTPTPAELQSASKLVAELFKNDIAKAKKPAERLALAKTLLQAGIEEQKDHAGRYFLLVMARDTAIGVGDMEVPFLALAELNKSYQVDTLALKAEALALLAKSTNSAASHKVIVMRCSEAMEDAVKVDRYDIAKKLADLALASARRSNDPPLVLAALNRSKEIAAIEEAYKDLAKAIQDLSKNSADSKANASVGRFRCFLKGDWVDGVSMLVWSDDADLRTLSEKELKSPADADELVALGDGWWSAAEKQTGFARTQIQTHAASFYQKAAPHLSGLSKAKVDNRLKTLLDQPQSLQARVAGSEAKVVVTATDPSTSTQKSVRLNAQHGVYTDASILASQLTDEQLQIAKGLHFGKITLPSRRGLTYFHMDVDIDNRSPQGRIENELSVEVRVLCVDADGKPNVTKYTHGVSIAAKGVQSVGLGDGFELQIIRTRNNNNEMPKNAYVAFLLGKVVFYEGFLSPPSNDNWWRKDELIVEGK